MSTFEETGLRPEILRAVTELGFDQPMPVQELVIPRVLDGRRDLVALAQTGTGKTAAFGLPLLHLVDAAQRTPQALVLCPTRELCLQISRDLEGFARYLPQVRVVAVYGGASIERQVLLLRRGAQVVVATPGRVLDLIRRQAVQVADIHTLVLDEADEMLHMGFQDELNAILAELPTERRTLLFSATMPREVATIAAKYMREPVEVTVGERNSVADTVDHHYYVVHAADRYSALKRIVDFYPSIYGIIFCRTRVEAKEVAGRLMEEGYSVDALHGELSQAARDLVMDRFRQKNLQLLVATDVAARGLDVEDLTHVINYTLPDEIENYTHRSGRTGRAGKRGVAVTIVHLRERGRIQALERMTRKRFERRSVPQGHEVCEQQLLGLIDRISNTAVDEEQIAPFMGDILSKFEHMDRDELIKKVVSAEFSRFLDYYRESRDLNVAWPTPSHELRGPAQGRDERPRGRLLFARLRVNVGARDGMEVRQVLGMINHLTGYRRIAIGKAWLGEEHTIFEADQRQVDTLLQAFQGARFGDRRLVLEVDRDTPPREDRPRQRPAGQGPRGGNQRRDR